MIIDLEGVMHADTNFLQSLTGPAKQHLQIGDVLRIDGFGAFTVVRSTLVDNCVEYTLREHD